MGEQEGTLEVHYHNYSTVYIPGVPKGTFEYLQSERARRRTGWNHFQTSDGLRHLKLSEVKDLSFDLS